MGWLARIAGASWFIYVKLAFFAAIVIAAAVIAWRLRGAQADEEQQKAVDAAVAQIQKDLDQEREWRGFYQGLADNQLTDLLNKLNTISGQVSQVKANLKVERAKNPEFYAQKLPEGGYAEWMRARSLVAAPAPSASQP